MFTSTFGLETHALEAIETQEKQERQTTRRSVLIVASDPTPIEAMSDRFAAEGYDVRIVSDGIIAMNELRRSLPDAIVADVDSPGLSGIELAEELRDWGLPIVLTSDLRDYPHLTGVTVLRRPLHVEALLKAIEQATAAAGASSHVLSS
jgi:CheY-like chemotaxis protein